MNFVMMRFLLSFLALASLISFSGCMHPPAPNLPAHWQGDPIPLESLEEAPSDKLYVFIMYDKSMCSHTVLRINSPEHGTVFWDPAGGSGTPEYPVVAKRKNDLVVDPIPTVIDYLAFRHHLPTSKVEIFEFDIEPDHSKRLIDLLRPLAGESRSIYKTKTAPMYCASTISRFLSEHASDVIPVNRHFFPHALSAELYEANPARIILWDYDSIIQYEVQ